MHIYTPTCCLRRAAVGTDDGRSIRSAALKAMMREGGVTLPSMERKTLWNSELCTTVCNTWRWVGGRPETARGGDRQTRGRSIAEQSMHTCVACGGVATVRSSTVAIAESQPHSPETTCKVRDKITRVCTKTWVEVLPCKLDRPECQPGLNRSAKPRRDFSRLGAPCGQQIKRRRPGREGRQEKQTHVVVTTAGQDRLTSTVSTT